MKIHLGRGTTASKTEAMFFPKPRCDDGTTKPNFNVADGFISYSRKFKYLGSHIVPSLDSEVEIDIRIKKASQALGALSESTFRNKDVRKHLKGRIYVALILTILLHGCETWFLREAEYQKLKAFHHSCVRAMCRVSIVCLKFVVIASAPRSSSMSSACSEWNTTWRAVVFGGRATLFAWTWTACHECSSRRGVPCLESLVGHA